MARPAARPDRNARLPEPMRCWCSHSCWDQERQREYIVNRGEIRLSTSREVARLANQRLDERDLAPLPVGLTAHKLRHTYASLLIATGEDPAYVMQQIGHSDPAFTLRLCTHAMRRQNGERGRLRALVQGRQGCAASPDTLFAGERVGAA